MFSLDTNFVKDLIQSITKKDVKLVQCYNYIFTLVTPDGINIVCEETHDSWQIEISSKLVRISLDEESLSKQELWELSNALKRIAQNVSISTIVNAVKEGAEVCDLSRGDGYGVTTKDWTAIVSKEDETFTRIHFSKKSCIDYIFYIESDVVNQVKDAKSLLKE